MKIGLLGGTFNPVHNGHLALAEAALKDLGLDKVIFIPAFIPPHKDVQENIPPKERLEMVRLAIKDNPKLEVSDHEIRQKGFSYSLDTVRYFSKRYGKQTRLYFLIGADSAAGLETWRGIGELKRLATFASAPRPGWSAPPEGQGIVALKMSPVDISSTAVRKMLKEGKPITGLVPPKVAEYIRKFVDKPSIFGDNVNYEIC